MTTAVRLGDFTALAKSYAHRTGYSESLLETLARDQDAPRPGFRIADVGAGTGKLTEHLLALGFEGFAVEPNEAMRQEGIALLGEGPRLRWLAGTAEATGLADATVDWVLMGSAFHWTDTPRALQEFHRVLRPGGRFTALWNPRDVDTSPLHRRIEARIHALLPDLQRVSSGSSRHMAGVEEQLLAGGLFTDVLFLEAPHRVTMSRARYLGAWRSVNDIQAQAGPEGFVRVLVAIEEELGDVETIDVPYRTRSWTVRRCD